MDKSSSERVPKFELPEFKEGQELASEKSLEKKDNLTSQSKKQKNRALKTFVKEPPQGPIQANATIIDDSGGSTAQGGQGTSLTASDVDLIEKHWVEKAKAIVAQTADDPYKQQKEISKEKAQYIKQRFDKTIPTGDIPKS